MRFCCFSKVFSLTGRLITGLTEWIVVVWSVIATLCTVGSYADFYLCDDLKEVRMCGEAFLMSTVALIVGVFSMLQLCIVCVS